ncbi:hypothetical protein KJA13_02740 [Patescibacteria group bacterium]|nr:hypothetical protein [Patescibacteria group bacterium]
MAKGKLKKRKYFYGISILGAFAAYCFANFTFPYIGLIKTILLSFLSLLFIQFLVNTTALAKRYLFGMACIVVLYFLSTGSSNFEDKFVVFIQGNGALSTKSILNKEFAMKPLNTKFGERDNTFDVTEILFQKWTKYCHLGLIKSGRYLYGLYNGRLNWAYTSYLTSPPSIQESLDILPFLLLPKNSSIIIIGAGGGMQVKYALFFDPKEVIALEPISEIIYALQNECPESNENIFLRKNVKCVTMEANRYLETVGQDYDLIYIINTGGKFGMFRRFIAPSHFSYSVQSFKQIKNKLKPGGVIAIAIEGSRHKRSGFLKQYFANLQKAGFIARGYLRERTELGKRSYLLVGYKDYIPNPSLSEEFEKRLLADNDLIIKVAEEFEINVKSH